MVAHEAATADLVELKLHEKGRTEQEQQKTRRIRQDGLPKRKRMRAAVQGSGLSGRQVLWCGQVIAEIAEILGIELAQDAHPDG